jgi:hypothetical protein
MFQAKIPFKSAETADISHEHGREVGWPSVSAAAPFARDCLLSHYLDSLFLKAKLLKQLTDPGGTEENVLTEVSHEIASFKAPNTGSLYWKSGAWAQAYRIELLLLLAEPVTRLAPELEYRLSQADDIGVKGIDRLKATFQRITTCQPPDPNYSNNLRCLLIETVKKIQWTLTKKYLSRVLLRTATKNIVFAALLSFVAFIFPYIIIFLDYYQSPAVADRVIHQWVGFPLLTCLSAGLFGSYFSRLLYIQKNSATLSYDELVSTKDVFAIIVRGSVGVCGAALLYFFLHSGIITGALIPDVSKMSVDLSREPLEYPRLLIANKDLALLIIWGFFAGFSERLIPSILATTEKKLETADGGAPDITNKSMVKSL